MGNTGINSKVEKLIRKYKTRDPFEILDAMGVIVGETSSYKNLKGYCFMSCRSIYVMISSFLSDEEKRMVAAHELGHIVLHKDRLKMAPMNDTSLFDQSSKYEYQANLFAADLLIEDCAITESVQDEDMDYFDMCRSLYVRPELMNFKLFSMIKRGHNYNLPMGIQSNFLGKD